MNAPFLRPNYILVVNFWKPIKMILPPFRVFQIVATSLVKCLFWSTFQNASNGVSKSVLLYEPTIEDDGRYLTCRAENAALRNTALEDQWTIQVHCKQLYCFYKGKSFKLIRCIADFDATLYTCVWGLAVLPTCLIAICKTSFGSNPRT